jgi:hypothetical protein
MGSTAADAAEKMWRSVLEEAGYSDLASSFSKSTLLKVGQELRSGSMGKVEEDFKRQGRAFKWDLMSQRFILDQLFAVDSIIAPRWDDGVNFVFDVTLRAEDVNKKVEKHQRLYREGVWEAAGLGVIKSAVVLLIPSPDWRNAWGWGLLSEQQKGVLVDEALDILVAMEERTSIVTKHAVTF